LNSSDLYSDILDALTNARSQMVSLPWHAALDAGTSDQRVAASNVLVQIQGAIVALSSAVLGDIATRMQANEAGLSQAATNLNKALNDIIKIQNVLNAAWTLIGNVGQIMPLL
jgi:uncharacterized protein YukE